MPDPRPAPPSLFALVRWPMLAAVLLGLPTLLYPFGRDQGNYAYAAWVIAEGGAAYRDVFLFKPPGTAFVHQLALTLFGVNMTAIRLLDLGWTAATAAAVTLLVWRLLGQREAAVWAGVAVPSLYWQIDYWNIAQTDGWLNLPCVLALLAVFAGADRLPARPRIAAALWLLGGVSVGFAITLKYTAGAILLPIALAAGYAATQHGWRALGAVPILGAGAAATVGAVATWLWATGGWEAFVQIQTELVPEYVRRTHKVRSWSQALERFITFDTHKQDVALLWWSGAGALLPAALFAAFQGRRGLATGAVVGSWWLLAVGSVIGQGKFYDYHYLWLLTPHAVFVGIALGGLTGLARRALGPRVVSALSVALVAGFVALTPLGGFARDAVEVTTGQTTWNAYLKDKRFYRYRSYKLHDQRRVVDHVKATTQPDDRIFVWSFDPAIHVWSQRRGVTRFLYNYPFRVDWGSPAYRQELLDGLRVSPPKLFLVSSKDATFGVTRSRKDSQQLLRDFTELQDFVDQGYVKDRSFGTYTVYRRADAE